MSSQLDNLVFSTTDHFKEADDTKTRNKDQGYIHIRIQQRNGRKSLTTIQGLADDLDLKKILRAFKKNLSTNGTILKDDEVGEVIQLQGDKRKQVAEFMVRYKICEKDEYKIHGF